jgi:hypothetical protein
MIGYLEELGEIWDTLDACYERPEKYMEEALKPILEFRKYRLFDNSAIREFSRYLGLLSREPTVSEDWASLSMTRQCRRSWARCPSPTGRSGPPRGRVGQGRLGPGL